MPASRLPSGADAMRLLERVAIKGVKFPSSLIMLSKVMFTLEGILGDIVGSDTADGLHPRASRRPALALQSICVPLPAQDAGLADTAVQRVALHEPRLGAVGAVDAEPLPRTQFSRSARAHVNASAIA